MTTSLDQQLARDYLLGRLPLAEAERFEEKYVSDVELFEHVCGVEHDLVDDYVAGHLDPADVPDFERQYLSSPVRAQRVEEARALRLRIRRVGRMRQAQGSSRAWLALAAVLVLGVAGAALYVASRDRAPAPTSAQAPTPSPAVPEATLGPAPVPAPAPPNDATAPAGHPVPGPKAPREPTVLAVRLSPILVRSSGAPPELRIASGTTLVEFTLEGDPTAPPLRAMVSTVEGREIRSGPARPGRRGQEAVAAVVGVPAARLVPADYLLRLLSLGPGDEATPVAEYYFRVQPHR